ncbi:1955_t:CDS:2 [Diversispora eburnea]|uniref:1955_t:CDS:1 n=1 Tax=Diversispora eburnea TaxID=1213867 RepID=A0A9N9BCH3_9GLOM|nr:1955_t:CDS:2 [Diversispora eburnea]
MTTLTTLPTELLQQILLQLDKNDLLSCFYQNSKLFCVVASLIWKNLGDTYWCTCLEKIPLRWKQIKRTLFSSLIYQKKKLELNTIQGKRILEGKILKEFKNGGELPEAEYWWIPDLI